MNTDTYGAHAFQPDVVPTTAQAWARNVLEIATHAMRRRPMTAHRSAQPWETSYELLLTRDPEILSAVIEIRRRRKHEVTTPETLAKGAGL